MFKKRGQGQSWSLDIILAFVVFVLIIGIFYALLSNNKNDKTVDLDLESKTVVSSLDLTNGQNNNLTVINQGVVEPDKLQTLYESDYMTLKRQLGIKGDFCIYVIDQYGGLVLVNTTSGQVGSFGGGNITINGELCGSKFS